MNGIDKITGRINQETREEIDRTMARAQEQRDEIKADFDQRAQAEYERLMREGAKDVELQAQRLSSAAAMEAKKSVLAMKQQAVSEVFTDARERICNLPEAEYIAFLSKLAADASFTGEEELIFNARDRAAVAKSVVKTACDLLKKAKKPANLTVSATTGDFSGGLMVKQGDIVVNCTVEKLVEMSRDKLSTQVAQVLFAE